MKLTKDSLSYIEQAIIDSIEKISYDSEQTAITDIHLQPCQGSGDLFIFDDDDNELAHTIVPEWTNNEDENFYENAQRSLNYVLHKMDESGIFEKSNMLSPFSFVLVDEEKETLSELLLINDDTLLVNDELLKGLDEELDNFLKELLEN